MKKLLLFIGLIVLNSALYAYNCDSNSKPGDNRYSLCLVEMGPERAHLFPIPNGTSDAEINEINDAGRCFLKNNKPHVLRGRVATFIEQKMGHFLKIRYVGPGARMVEFTKNGPKNDGCHVADPFFKNVSRDPLIFRYSDITIGSFPFHIITLIGNGKKFSKETIINNKKIRVATLRGGDSHLLKAKLPHLQTKSYLKPMILMLEKKRLDAIIYPKSEVIAMTKEINIYREKMYKRNKHGKKFVEIKFDYALYENYELGWLIHVGPYTSDINEKITDVYEKLK